MSQILAPLIQNHYQDKLELLQQDSKLQGIISKVGASHSWWSANRKWKRIYARFDPHSVSYVTMLFETTEGPQEICQIEASSNKLSESGKFQISMSDREIGFLRMTKFPCDPLMPMLQEVLARPGQATVVRYRPRKRCTIRFDYLDTNQVEYAKVLAGDSGAGISRDNIELWSAYKKHILHFAVARPIRWEPETRTLWQGKVDGVPVKERLFNRNTGFELAGKMGIALASLSQSGLQPAMTFDGHAQMERSSRYANELSDRIPSLDEPVNQLIQKLTAIHSGMGGHQKVPIHGAPHVHQWLYNGTCLGLVDFDRFCLGDPELDVATFISEMDFENPKKVPIQEINNAFQNGYESLFGPLNTDLLNAYRAHKRLAKALKAARAVRPDYERRPKRNLQRALECLK